MTACDSVVRVRGVRKTFDGDGPRSGACAPRKASTWAWGSASASRRVSPARRAAGSRRCCRSRRRARPRPDEGVVRLDGQDLCLGLSRGTRSLRVRRSRGRVRLPVLQPGSTACPSSRMSCSPRWQGGSVRRRAAETGAPAARLDVLGLGSAKERSATRDRAVGRSASAPGDRAGPGERTGAAAGRRADRCARLRGGATDEVSGAVRSAERAGVSRSSSSLTTPRWPRRPAAG